MNDTPAAGSFTVVLGVALLVSCAPAFDWREFRPDGAVGLVAQFPCKPASHARVVPLAGVQVRTTLHACAAGGVTWGLALADVRDPLLVSPALGELRTAAAANLAAGEPRPITGHVPGATPNPQAGRVALAGKYPDGRAANMQLAVFARGTVVIQATALGERLDREAVDSFYEALRIAP